MSELDLFFENKMNEECGVFGVFNHENAAELTYYGFMPFNIVVKKALESLRVMAKCFIEHKGEDLFEMFIPDKISIV